MSGVYLGTNFDIITFLKKSGYWETQKCQMPRSEHCMLTAPASYCVLLCIITCLCSVYVFVYPLSLSPFQHVVPSSTFVLEFLHPSLSLSLSSWQSDHPTAALAIPLTFNFCPEIHECWKAIIISSVLQMKTKQSCHLLWTSLPAGKYDSYPTRLVRCLQFGGSLSTIRRQTPWSTA